MGDQLLDAMCDRLKPVLYTEGSCVVREGDPVNEMLFIMRGNLMSMTTNGGRTGFFNSDVLRDGALCGEELLTWAIDPMSTSSLPSSTRTVKTMSEVEAFVLRAEDLKFVATQFRRLHSKQLQHTFRFYSQQWRTWAACFIQAAWHRHCRKKIEDSLREQEKRLQFATSLSFLAGHIRLTFCWEYDTDSEERRDAQGILDRFVSAWLLLAKGDFRKLCTVCLTKTKVTLYI
jgi:cyclic nucleotide gated channel, plant